MSIFLVKTTLTLIFLFFTNVKKRYYSSYKCTSLTDIDTIPSVRLCHSIRYQLYLPSVNAGAIAVGDDGFWGKSDIKHGPSIGQVPYVSVMSECRFLISTRTFFKTPSFIHGWWRNAGRSHFQIACTHDSLPGYWHSTDGLCISISYRLPSRKRLTVNCTHIIVRRPDSSPCY